MHPAAEQWVGILNGKLVCHRGVIQFPMRKGWKRGHRMVVLPDYQGIGIGTAFENYTSKHYVDLGWNINITTTTPALVHALARDKNWVLVRNGRNKSSYKDFEKYGKGDAKKNKTIANTITKQQSNNRITYSFNWKK